MRIWIDGYCERTPAGARANGVTTACLAALSLSVAACGTDAPAPSQTGVVTDTIGDTIVVRTLSGSVWGVDATLEPEVSIGELDGPEEYLFGRVSSIAVDDQRNVYVLDWQPQQILQYDERGEYVRTLARRGAGPGELDDADQMMFLPDGRLVVRDGGNQRMHLFGPGALERDEWPLANPHLPGPHRIWTDTAGRTYTFHLDIPATSMEAMLKGVVVVRGPDGVHLDTLPGPETDFDPPELDVQRVVRYRLVRG